MGVLFVYNSGLSKATARGFSDQVWDLVQIGMDVHICSDLRKI